MEFWGAKVKAGQTLKVKPGENCLIHISQASFGKAKKGVSALLYATVDAKKLLLGTLSQDSFPHINFDHLFFDREFELSHSLDRGYVHFIGNQRKKKKKKKRANESSKVSVSFSTGKSVLQPCLESKTNLKKQKIHKENSEEIKEMNKSIKELSEAVKTLQQVLLTKADLPEEKETPKKKMEEEEDSCCFGCKEARGNDERTIFVKGFENLRPRNEIKTALSNFFSSCGEITRVYVPIECKNRLPLGFAFINLRNGEGNDKALELNGSYMGGRELEVTMASHRDEFYGFTDFHGCERCPMFLCPPVYNPSSIKKRRIVYW